jgi:hypothetical protein
MVTDCLRAAFNIVRADLPALLPIKVRNATVALPRGRTSFSDSIPDGTHRCVTRIHDILTSTMGREILEASRQGFVRNTIGGYPHGKGDRGPSISPVVILLDKLYLQRSAILCFWTRLNERKTVLLRTKLCLQPQIKYEKSHISTFFPSSRPSSSNTQEREMQRKSTVWPNI